MASLSRDLANDKAERSASLNGVLRQAEMQVANLCEALKDDVRRTIREGDSGSGTGGGFAQGTSGGPGDYSNNDLDRLARELSEERAERRQLALELHNNTSDTEKIHSLMATTNEHLMNLSRELSKLAKGGGVKNDYAQRLESLGKELRSTGIASAQAATGSALGSRSSSGSSNSGSMSSWALLSRTLKTRMTTGRSLQAEGIPTIEEETEASTAVDADTGSDAGDRPVSQMPWGAVPSG